MRALALAILAQAALLSGPAVAQAVDWSGPYAGVLAGYAWGRGHATSPYDAATGYYYNFSGDPYGVSAGGAIAGGVIGNNWQMSGGILGVEGEAGYMDIRGRRLDPNAVAHGWDDTFTSLKGGVYGTASLRAGIRAGDGLLYAKAGVALLGAKGATIDACVAPPVGCGTEMLTMTGDKTLVGWSVGAGLEWPLDAHWSVRAEYAYFDFGKIAVAGGGTANDFYTQTIGVKAHTARAGVSYRW
ncbi:MAG: outer membrane beta-barrel protein [Alphaproteobacteria bacterium]|nr:outer membrane beta-barrel protein [Alphaproteobacteria bacterium]